MTSDVVDDPAIPYTSDDRLNSQSADRRNKIKLKKKDEKVERVDVDTQNPAVSTSHTQEIAVDNQLVLNKDKMVKKRKTVKGLKARIPAKIQKNNKGEKRLHNPAWEESQQKKIYIYNIVRVNPKYDLWNL